MLRRPAALDALLDALGDVDRLVLLGDTLELREDAVHRVLERAEPVLRRLRDRLAGRPVVLVPGNHDHPIAAGWLESRAGAPLRLEERVAARDASHAARACAQLLAPSPVELAYPGLWLDDGVYATHGHYLDVHMTVPTLERLIIAGSGRVALGGGRRWDDARTPGDYEAVLAPVYAWSHAVAQSGRASDGISGGRTVAVWNALRPGGRRSAGAVALATLFPVAVRALNALGMGPLRSELSMSELRRAGLRAMSEVVERLHIDAAHVIFGHTHRAGMLPDDLGAEWLTPNGVRLHNTGSWVRSPTFASGPQSPYWPGTAIRVSPGEPPALLRLLADREPAELDGLAPAPLSAARAPAPA